MDWSIFLGLLVFYGAQYVTCQDSDLNNITIRVGLQILQTENATRNLIYSPTTISFNMALLYLGTKGETKSQIGKYMFNGLTEQAVNEYLRNNSETWSTKWNPSKLYNMSYANGIFVRNQYPILEEYRAKLSRYFPETYVMSLDFVINPESSRQQINSWVEEATNHEIKGFFREHALDNAQMVLVNAVYFKGNWKNKFNQSETMKKDFFAAENKRTIVNMMSQSNMQFYYFEDAKVQVLGLPFDGDKDRQLVMYIILPVKRFGLDEVVSTLTIDRFRDLIKKGRDRTIVTVELPKFKLENDFNEIDMFKRLGITDVFDSKLADLSGVDGSKSLYISDMRHSLYLEVNEEGTKVVKVLAGISKRDTTELPIAFKVDQPFLFAVVDKVTLNVRFMGRIVNLQ